MSTEIMAIVHNSNLYRNTMRFRALYLHPLGSPMRNMLRILQTLCEVPWTPLTNPALVDSV